MIGQNRSRQDRTRLDGLDEKCQLEHSKNRLISAQGAESKLERFHDMSC
jgi:hypothetical protein